MALDLDLFGQKNVSALRLIGPVLKSYEDPFYFLVSLNCWYIFDYSDVAGNFKWNLH